MEGNVLVCKEGEFSLDCSPLAAMADPNPRECREQASTFMLNKTTVFPKNVYGEFSTEKYANSL